MTAPSLVLGAFSLTRTDGSTRVLADGTSRGNPVPLETTVKTWLQDGAIVVTQGYDNREMSLRVRFFGTDLTALSTLEASLVAELNKPNTLTWTPSSGPATVFDVVTSSLTWDDSDDDGEGQVKPWRTYVVRLVCLPFGRSAAEVTATAVTVTGTTTTTVDAMSATTGWTGTINGSAATVVNSSGTNSVTQAAAAGTYAITMAKTLSQSTATLKLLVVDWKPSAVTLDGTTSGLTVTNAGVSLPIVAQGASPTSGYTRSWFYVAASALGAVELSWTSTQMFGQPTPPARVLTLDNISVTDAPPSYGTNRQQMRAFDVSGSARTQGSLAIESATAALGDVLVYTFPAEFAAKGYTPSLRQYRTAGNTVTSNAALVSGSSEDLIAGTGITFTIPMGLFPPGSYVLLVRAADATSFASTFTYTTQTTIGGNAVGPQTATSGSVSLTASYNIFAIARLQLPTVDLDQLTPASMTLILKANGFAATLDEAWLYNTSIGNLIQVACGTGAGTVGGSARRLFVEPATAGQPRPTIRIGHSADRSDSFCPQTIKSWDTPVFQGPRTAIQLVTTNATDATATLRHFPRWHTNASL